MSIVDDRFRDVEKLSPFTLSPFEEGKYAHSSAYDFQEWYKAIEPVTFKTEQIPLEVDQGRSMVKVYKQLLNKEPIEIADEEKLNELKRNLARVFKGCNDQGIRKFFLRFSSRSPKDAGFSDFYRPKMLEILQNLVYKYPQKDYYSNIPNLDGLFVDLWETVPKEGEEKKERVIKAHGEFVYVPDAIHDNALIANYQTHLFYEALGELLSVENENEALNLFLNSERAFTDLQYDLRHLKNDKWGMNVVIREWDSHTNIQFEFRVFVSLGKVNAISQYNPYAYYPALQGRHEELKNKIVEHHEGIKDQIPYATYVIDYLVVGDYVKVVELNPFSFTTGGCLFKWEHERRELQGGIDIWGDLEEWESKYGIEYSAEEKAEKRKETNYPIVRIRETLLPNIVDYAAIQESYFRELSYEPRPPQPAGWSWCSVL